MGVDPETIVRVRFSAPVDPTTVNGSTFELLESSASAPVSGGTAVDVFGEVATLTPSSRLRTSTTYTVRLNEGIRGQDGQSLVLFQSSFTTGDTPGSSGLTFSASKIDGRDRNTSLAFGPDGNLYVADVAGEVRRYVIDAATGATTSSDVPLTLPRARRMLGIAFDPAATSESLLLWASYALDNGGRFEGVISRFALPPRGSQNAASEQRYVVGLPNRDGLAHMTNGLAFGPDGALYIAQGGATGAGSTSSEGETESLMSAAVLRADVGTSGFGGGSLPVDVSPQNRYDPFVAGAPVTLFATGLRNTYDLAWHSNGSAYAGTNETGGNASTPACGGAPSVNSNPPDSFVRLVAGGYYGHPNPSRGECVLKGGNPTAGFDPLEVVEYPVGIVPDPDFDPRLHHRFNPADCISPNGVAEYTASGPAQGWLLTACFAGGQRVQALRVDPMKGVVEERPLRRPDGEVIHFPGILDVAVHESGRVYVADFGEDGGTQRVPGGIWMLQPAQPTQPTAGAPAFVSAATARASGTSLSIPRPENTSAGQVLLAALRQKKTTGTVTAPPGWTMIRTDVGSARSSLYYRVATASDPTSYRFSVSADDGIEGHILAYTGVDPANPIAAHGVSSNTGTQTGTTVVAPSLSPPTATTTYVAFWSAKVTGLKVTAAPGTTERTDTSSSAVLATADQTLSGTGPSGTRTATLSAASDRRIGQAVLLRPGGGGPPPPPQSGSYFSFNDVTESAGLSVLSNAYSHSAAWGDVDGDGLQDLFVGTFADKNRLDGRTPSSNRLLLNRANTFVSAGQPSVEVAARTAGSVFADLDNDGDLDLMVSTNRKVSDRSDAIQLEPHHLYRNESGTFVDVSASSGIRAADRNGRSVGVLDYDNDGRLDLFVVADSLTGDGSRVSKLMRNTGNLTFTDHTVDAGLPTNLAGLGVAVGDANGDGWPDLVVTGGVSASGSYARTFLYVNQRNGTFRDATTPQLAWTPRTNEDWTAGAAWGDLNRDGRLDLVVTHHFATAASNPLAPRVYLNDGNDSSGNPILVELAGAGLDSIATKAPHVEVQDFDNDGWPDIYVSVRLHTANGPAPYVYRHLGSLTNGRPSFTSPLGTIAYYSPGGPTADYDGDGKLDVFLEGLETSVAPSLLRNTTATSGNWLDVSVSSASNRMGLGAKVQIYRAGELGQPGALLGTTEISTGNGFSSAQPAIAHMGLGNQAAVDVAVTPPFGGTPVTRSGVVANQRITVNV